MSKRILISTVTSVMLISAAVPAFAFGFGRGMHFRGNLPEDLQEQFEACNDLGNREEMRECHRKIMDQYREENGIEAPDRPMGFGMRGKGMGMKNLPEDVKGKVEACRENNEETEAIRECVRGVMEKYMEENGIGVPPAGFVGRGGRCMGAGFFRLAPQEVRDELSNCSGLGTWEEVRSCVVEALE